MSTGQSVLTVIALMLVSVMILNFQRTANNITSELDNSRFRLEAASILTSHVEKLSQYYFDECSNDTLTDKALSDFTLPSNLGFETNDSLVADDIDDFHNITLSDTGLSGVVYRTKFQVDYITLNSTTKKLDKSSSSRTYHKRFALTVTDANPVPLITRYQNGVLVRDTLRAQTVISYWFYN